MRDLGLKSCKLADGSDIRGRIHALIVLPRRNPEDQEPARGIGERTKIFGKCLAVISCEAAMVRIYLFLEVEAHTFLLLLIL
jgi:hypothetical protein